MPLSRLALPQLQIGRPVIALSEGGGYEAEALALFARFTTPPSSTLKTKINRRIRKYKLIDRWNSLDALYGFKAADEQSAFLNWKSTSYGLTKSGTGTLTQNRAFAGNGTTGYLRSGFNPSTSGSLNHLLNSAMIGVWVRNPATGAARFHIGGNEGSSHYSGIEATAGDIVQGRLNQANAGPVQVGGNAGVTGSLIMQRTASNAEALYVNGVQGSSVTTVSSALPNVELYLCARNSGGTPAGFSSDQEQGAWIGAAFASVEKLVKTHYVELDYVTDIVAWGDSLTAGAGASSSATRYPAVAGDSFSPVRDVSNQGIGGQTSTQIAARMGAQPIEITVTGNEIPASGGVAVTAKNINTLVNSGVFSGSMHGTVAGVYGRITTDASGNWTFTRSDAGSATACPADSVFVPALADTFNETTSWLWAGRNGAQSGYTVAGDIAAAAAMITTGRYLVGAILTSADDSAGNITALQALNASLASTYGSRFVDLMAILQAANDGSANDLADIAAGYTPRSLRSDAVHLNDAGYAIVAAAWKNATVAMGW